ncbi:hypothetical protein BX666DRAFT_132599 [Dichotomocladium elegans]|nr:hypothetical protein BX666DRAFT_132599 [Dichotomocladium elegans]
MLLVAVSLSSIGSIPLPTYLCHLSFRCNSVEGRGRQDHNWAECALNHSMSVFIIGPRESMGTRRVGDSSVVLASRYGLV